MRKRLLALAAVAGLAIGGGLAAAPSASAACEGGGNQNNDDPRGNGNELVGVYVENVPVGYALLGEDNHTDLVWVEVQDDGEQAPVSAEAGWKGRQHVPEEGTHFGLSTCSDSAIEMLNTLPDEACQGVEFFTGEECPE